MLLIVVTLNKILDLYINTLPDEEIKSISTINKDISLQAK